MFAREKDIGKSILSDLQEAKKTILLWHAYRHAAHKDRTSMRKILAKQHIGHDDLAAMKKIVIAAKSLDYAKQEIASLIRKAEHIRTQLTMKKRFRDLLDRYSQQFLQV
jgi:geranylgeranyl diphosphate synthase type I